MKIGDIVWLPKGTKMRLSCGIEVPMGQDAAVEVASLTDGRLGYKADGQDRSAEAALARPLPCCYIFADRGGWATPVTCCETVRAPLAALGVQTMYIPHSHVWGLQNVPQALDTPEFRDKVALIVWRGKA